MKAVITGGAGFIGTNLALALLERGDTVTVVELPTADCSHLPSEIRVVRADINRPNELVGIFGNQHIVYHLAARTDLDGRSIKEYETNYTGTVNVIEEVMGGGGIKRFVFYSTQLVVGLFNETRFIDESEPYKTTTIYGKSKILGEKSTIELCSKYNIPFTIIRPTAVYGPYGKEPYQSLFKLIREGRYFHIGKGSNLVSMVYVKNLIDLTLLLSSSEQASGGIFFGNDFHPYTMREFADTIARFYRKNLLTVPDFVAYPAAYMLGLIKLLGINVPLYPFRLRNIKANSCYDIHNSVRLGYDPQHDLQSGVFETLEWYEQNVWNKESL